MEDGIDFATDTTSVIALGTLGFNGEDVFAYVGCGEWVTLDVVDQVLALLDDDTTPCDVEPDYDDPDYDAYDDDGGFVVDDGYGFDPGDPTMDPFTGRMLGGLTGSISSGSVVNSGMFDPSHFSSPEEGAIVHDARTEYVIRDKSSDQFIAQDGTLSPDIRRVMTYASENEAQGVRRTFDHSSDYDVRPIVISLSVM